MVLSTSGTVTYGGTHIVIGSVVCLFLCDESAEPLIACCTCTPKVAGVHQLSPRLTALSVTQSGTGREWTGWIGWTGDPGVCR